MDGEIKSLIEVWTIAVSLICYCYYVASRFPKGFLRLISLFPVLYIFTILPLNLRFVHFCATTFFCLTWLANFKLLLFAFNQHPLLFPPGLLPNLFHFAAIFCLPIKIKKHPSAQNQQETKPTQEKLLVFAFKLLIYGISISLNDFKQHVHHHIVFVFYCLNLYLGAEMILILFLLPATAIFGASMLDQHFNEPYLSTSLQDFWSHRWNLMVPNILRLTIYNPTRNTTSHMFGRRWARLLAMAASFTVSGLMHELLYYYITRKNPTWEVTSFFILHGICTAAEVAAKDALAGRLRLPPVVSRPLTLAFLIVTARWLMFTQLFRDGDFERLVGEYSIMINFVKAKLLLLF